jgi:hypothetical protein
MNDLSTNCYLINFYCRFWNEELELAAHRKREPSLLRVIARCFGAKIMVYGFVLFTMEVLLR